MASPLPRRRGAWPLPTSLAVLAVAGWLLVRLVTNRRAPVGTGGAAARRSAHVTPSAELDHRPASSPHAGDIAAHNRRVIEEYQGRHAGTDGA